MTPSIEFPEAVVYFELFTEWLTTVNFRQKLSTEYFANNGTICRGSTPTGHGKREEVDDRNGYRLSGGLMINCNAILFISTMFSHCCYSIDNGMCKY